MISIVETSRDRAIHKSHSRLQPRPRAVNPSVFRWIISRPSDVLPDARHEGTKSKRHLCRRHVFLISAWKRAGNSRAFKVAFRTGTEEPHPRPRNARATHTQTPANENRSRTGLSCPGDFSLSCSWNAGNQKNCTDHGERGCSLVWSFLLTLWWQQSDFTVFLGMVWRFTSVVDVLTFAGIFYVYTKKLFEMLAV